MADRLFELGFRGPLRDALIASVLSGATTATTPLLAQYEDDGEPLAEPGRYVMIDSDEVPVAIVEVTEVKLIRLGDADLQLALDEGEGFQSVAQWRAAHERFWSQHIRPALRDPSALHLDDETIVVVEASASSSRRRRPSRTDSRLFAAP